MKIMIEEIENGLLLETYQPRNELYYFQNITALMEYLAKLLREKYPGAPIGPR